MLRLSTGAGEREVLIEHPAVARRLARTAPELRLIHTVAGVPRVLAVPGPGELRPRPHPVTGAEEALQRWQLTLPGPGVLEAGRGPERARLTQEAPQEATGDDGAGCRVLVTGFEPFPTPAPHDNVSRLALTALDPRLLGDGVRLHRALLPVEFGAAAARLRGLIRRLRPHVVLALGQGQDQLALELVARNRTGRLLTGGQALRDNAGGTRPGVPLEVGGPAELDTRLRVAPLVDGLRRVGEQPVTSLDAGTFICNEVFYGLLRELDATATLGGFVHLPRARACDARVRARWGQVATALVREMVRRVGA